MRGEVFFTVEALRQGQRRADGAGQDAVRQPAQRGRRQPAAEGSAGHRVAAAAADRARRRARGRASSPKPQSEAYEQLQGVGPADLATGGRWCRTWPACASTSHYYDEAPPRRRARDRRRRGQGGQRRAAAAGSARPAGRRAGRSRTSTRPRRRPPSCSTSRSTSAAPGGSPRSRCWSRSSWAASTVTNATLHNAQRRGAPGRAHRRHGDRAPGRRRHPRDRRRRWSRQRDGTERAFVMPTAVPGLRHRSWRRPRRATSTSAAPTPAPARRSCASGCSTWPAGARFDIEVLGYKAAVALLESGVIDGRGRPVRARRGEARARRRSSSTRTARLSANAGQAADQPGGGEGAVHCGGSWWRCRSGTSARPRPSRWPTHFGSIDAIAAAATEEIAARRGRRADHRRVAQGVVRRRLAPRRSSRSGARPACGWRRSGSTPARSRWPG